MKNENYSQDYNQNHNQNYGQKYDDNNQNLYDQPWRDGRERAVRKNTNTVLIVALIVAIIVLMGCITLAAFLTDKKDVDSKTPKKEKTAVKVDEANENQEDLPEEEPVEKLEPAHEEEKTPKTVPVGKTMYVQVNDYLVLRSGPGKGYAEKGRMYRGDAVYVIEYVTDEFARVTYNGTQGYASRQYLSHTQPAPVYRWNYSEYEIESIVAGSLNWYVNAVNTGNTGGAEYYFSGPIRQTEINNASTMANKVSGERLINVRCHSYKRLSPTRVSVVRESNIEIYELNGNSRIASEKRVYVLENTGSGTYIVDIHQ